jgi:hypothetical protein
MPATEQTERRANILAHAENPDTCRGCGIVLDFDWGLGDYPEACGACADDVYQSADSERYYR